MSVVIDIKTGKAEPWAALQLAAQSLLNDFDVDFDADSHVYTYNGQHWPSITQILKAEGFIDTSHYDTWSRDKGAMVHLAVKYHIFEELDEDRLDPVIIPYLDAFKRFKEESGLIVTQSEMPGVNTVHRYAGTPDIIGCFPKPTGARRFALELHPDGKYKLIPYTEQNDFNVWISAVSCHYWKLNNLKKGK